MTDAITVLVTVEQIVGIEGDRGYTFIVSMVTDDGSVLKWHASRALDTDGNNLRQGSRYMLAATITKPGDKETLATRANLTPNRTHHEPLPQAT